MKPILRAFWTFAKTMIQDILIRHIDAFETMANVAGRAFIRITTAISVAGDVYRSFRDLVVDGSRLIGASIRTKIVGALYAVTNIFSTITDFFEGLPHRIAQAFAALTFRFIGRQAGQEMLPLQLLETMGFINLPDLRRRVGTMETGAGTALTGIRTRREAAQAQQRQEEARNEAEVANLTTAVVGHAERLAGTVSRAGARIDSRIGELERTTGSWAARARAGVLGVGSGTSASDAADAAETEAETPARRRSRGPGRTWSTPTPPMEVQRQQYEAQEEAADSVADAVHASVGNAMTEHTEALVAPLNQMEDYLSDIRDLLRGGRAGARAREPDAEYDPSYDRRGRRAPRQRPRSQPSVDGTDQ